MFSLAFPKPEIKNRMICAALWRDKKTPGAASASVFGPLSAQKLIADAAPGYQGRETTRVD
jgi:hypothetical protein